MRAFLRLRAAPLVGGLLLGLAVMTVQLDASTARVSGVDVRTHVDYRTVPATVGPGIVLIVGGAIATVRGRQEKQ